MLLLTMAVAAAGGGCAAAAAGYIVVVGNPAPTPCLIIQLVKHPQSPVSVAKQPAR
jgi:hypothetical protein